MGLFLSRTRWTVARDTFADELNRERRVACTQLLETRWLPWSCERSHRTSRCRASTSHCNCSATIAVRDHAQAEAADEERDVDEIVLTAEHFNQALEEVTLVSVSAFQMDTSVGEFDEILRAQKPGASRPRPL